MKQTHPLYRLLQSDYGAVYAETAYDIRKFEDSLIVSLTTRECLFIGREHTSNHLRLVLSRSGASLRCFSKGDERCHGRFNPIPFKVLDEEVRQFFCEKCGGPLEQNASVYIDICDGGESEIEAADETAVERPTKKRKKNTKNRKESK